MTASSPDLLLLPLWLALLLALLSLLILLTGLLGNLTVLYATLRHNALKLDPASLLLVQNLAVADVCYIGTTVLPSAVTYLAGRYVLGEVYCFVNGVVFMVPGSVNTLTVLALTGYRLLLVKAPHRRLSPRAMRGVVAVIWVLATGPLWVCVAYRGKSVFRQTYAACVTDVYEDPVAKVPVQVTLGLVIMAPLLLTTSVNVYLCLIALTLRRAAQDKLSSIRVSLNAGSACQLGGPRAPRYRNNPLVTVCLVSGCFIATWLPYVVYVMWKTYTPQVPTALELGAFHAIHLNTAVNPILFTFTCKRFNGYVKRLVRRAWSCGRGGSGSGMQVQVTLQSKC